MLGFVLALSIGVFISGFMLSLLLNRTPAKVLAAVPTIPLFVWGQLAGFMNIRRANKDFMVTDHSITVELAEVWASRSKEFDHLAAWWKA